jgi:hypothetical protein
LRKKVLPDSEARITFVAVTTSIGSTAIAAVSVLLVSVCAELASTTSTSVEPDPAGIILSLLSSEST